VQGGETLSWIASLYNISLNDLMTWNGMNINSIIQPEDKLLLQVTPPATLTPTPGPPTATPTATRTPNPPTITLTPSPTPPKPTATSTPNTALGGNPLGWVGLVVLVIAGVIVAWGMVMRGKMGTGQEEQ
jgi:LysM repeat protein